MTKVFFSLVPFPQAEWEGESYRNFVLDLFSRQTAPRFAEQYCLAEDEDSADLIVVLEPISFKSRVYGAVLRSMRCIERDPTRVFTINYDDGPLPFLPGIYAAMPVRRFEAGFTVAGGYLVNSPNPFVGKRPESRHFDPKYLFSFRGALSSPVRRRMLRNRSVIYADERISRFTVIDRWFNHSDVEQREYVEEILKSKFVLCPCGQGTASHRLFEVMELGRVPVIIADEWVAPDGPRWSDFSIRVAESDILSIPAYLSDRESAFETMATKARATWKQFFAPETRLGWMLGQLEALKAERDRETADYRVRWSRYGFYRGNLGTAWERARKRFGFD
jgi:Exostosin family